jgi:hypothetical protein
MRFPHRLVAVVIGLLVLSAAFNRAQPPIHATSTNLVWKPYLQQLSDTSVMIQWTTRTGETSAVHYGTDTGSAQVAHGVPSSIAALNMQMHRVALTGLQPDTTYSYKIYTDEEDLWPEQRLAFRTAPSPGSATPFSFLAFGDFGKNTDSQKRLRDQMARDSFRFVVSTGDNAYAAGTYAEFDTNVFQIYGDVFSKAAFFPTLGNHDYATGSGAPYLDLFSLPRNAWRSSHQERYYSFDYGSVHVVALDTNTPLDAIDSAATDDMFDWLRDDLSRTTQPWIIAVVHHAPYSTGGHGSDSRAQTKLVPIFEQYGVDLVLSGHDHIYQRSKPLRGGQVTTVEQGGIPYIVSGAGSAADYGCTSAEWVAVAYCAKTYGIYSRVQVTGSRLTVEAIDDAGAVRDSFSLGQSTVPGAIAVPGRFEVEDYKAGGPGVGYSDSTSGNSGAVYRSDDVDIQTCSDGSPCYNVGWTTAGEWLAYDIQVPASGNYTFMTRAATPNSGKQFHIEVDGVNVSGALAVPNTGGWQTWTNVTSPPIALTSGQHTVRIVSDTGSMNLNYVVVSEHSLAPSPIPTLTQTPTATSMPTATSTPTTAPEPTSTPTIAPEPEPTSTPTTAPEPEPTSTPTTAPEPTSTPTTAPSPTATTEPSSTPSPTATTEPSSTPSPTATNTALPSSTPSIPTAATAPTSIPTNTPTVIGTTTPTSPTIAPSKLTFTTSADARVEEAFPGTNYGTSSSLRADGSSDPDVESYLRFSVTGVTGAVQSARLRVYATSGTSNGPAVYATGNEWSETAITWSTRPARTSGALDDRGTVATNAWAEYDLSALVKGNGTYNVVLATDSTDGISLSSRQGSYPPQLVVTFASGTPTPSPTPSAIPVPGRFEVEDYKVGGAGVGYSDSTSGNSGAVYRSDDVDIQTTTDSSGAYNVAWVTAGEWLAYDIQVPANGSYTFGLRFATPNSGRQVHLEVDGVNVSGTIAVPNTGSWQVWSTVTTKPIALSAGRHTLRLVADTAGLNLNYVTVAGP